MKLSFASVAYATILALSATSGDAATTLVTFASTTIVAAPGASTTTIGFTSADAHSTTSHTFVVELPETFDAVLTEAAVVTSELTMTCTTGTGAGDSITLGTDYDGTYVAATRKLTLTSKAVANKMCIAGAVSLALLKSTVRAPNVVLNTVKVQNTALLAEVTTPVTGPAANVVLVAALTGTLGAPSFDDETFAINYTATGDLDTQLVTVALDAYTFAAGSTCSVGGTALTPTSPGAAIDGYDFVTFTLTSSAKFSTTLTTVECTKVTRTTNETAIKVGGVQLWVANANAGFKDTKISTHSPTASPTAGPPVASGGACTVSVTTCVTNNTCTVTNATASATVGTCKAAATPTNAPPTAAPVTPTAAGGHSSALSLSSAPLMLAALMVGLGLMN